jgi:hypothetical protein
MDATKQTAVGDGFEELDADPLDFGDLEPFGLFERLELRDPFLFEFLPVFFLFFESTLADRAGVACLGLPAEPS